MSPRHSLIRLVLRRSSRLLWVVVLLALPILLLVPFGVLWLWQHGMLLIWLSGTLLLTLAGYLAAWWFARRGGSQEGLQAGFPPGFPERQSAASIGGTEGWSPRDRQAWIEVLDEAATVDKDAALDRAYLVATAERTIERVARHYHPEDRDPVWSFTGPELLMLVERVSQRLRLIVLEHVPGAHLIEARHLMRAWELKPTAETGWKTFKHLHTAWRVSRVVNPIAALMAEARQFLVNTAVHETTDYLRTQGLRIWVEEVGRAAIELYSGRLRVDLERMEAIAGQERGATDTLGPVRILIAGRVNSGKSSLTNLLLGEVMAGVSREKLTVRSMTYALEREGLPESVLIDTPGLESTEGIDSLVADAWRADFLLWVSPLDTSDRALDRLALDGIRARYASDPRRNLLPILVVVSRVEHSSSPRGLESGLRKMAEELAISPSMLVPMTLLDPLASIQQDVIWERLTQLYPEARRNRAQRLQIAAGSGNWRRVLTQTRGAARLLKNRLPWSRTSDSSNP